MSNGTRGGLTNASGRKRGGGGRTTSSRGGRGGGRRTPANQEGLTSDRRSTPQRGLEEELSSSSQDGKDSARRTNQHNRMVEQSKKSSIDERESDVIGFPKDDRSAEMNGITRDAEVASRSKKHLPSKHQYNRLTSSKVNNSSDAHATVPRTHANSNSGNTNLNGNGGRINANAISGRETKIFEAAGEKSCIASTDGTPRSRKRLASSASDRSREETGNVDSQKRLKFAHSVEDIPKKPGFDSQVLSEIRNMYRTVVAEGRSMRNAVKDLKEEIADMKENIREINERGTVNSVANANSLTPKKAFEEIMMTRLESIDAVFNSSSMQVACWKIFVRFILSRAGNSVIPFDDTPFVIEAIMYGLPREWKGSESKDKLGEASSEMRQCVIIECVRQTARLKCQSAPFWLKPRGGKSSTSEGYICRENLNVGFERRERGRSVGDKSLKRRNAIASGSTRPGREDDSEFIGWWAYGQLNKFLNQGRKNASALVFESVFYLFVPWKYAVDDRIYTVDNLNELPPMTDVKVEDVSNIIGKGSVEIQWRTSIDDVGPRGLEIPDCVVATRNVETCENNRRVYEAFANKQENLILVVEHSVLVHKDRLNKGLRHRKGGTRKTFRRTLSLLDTATAFITGMRYGDRNLFAWDFMMYNKHSLRAIYNIAICLRRIIELKSVSENISVLDSQRNRSNSLDGIALDEKQTSTLKLFDVLLPSDQQRGRIMSRCLWGVRESDYKKEHVSEGLSMDLEKDARGEKDSSHYKSVLLIDEEDEEDESDHDKNDGDNDRERIGRVRGNDSIVEQNELGKSASGEDDIGESERFGCTDRTREHGEVMRKSSIHQRLEDEEDDDKEMDEDDYYDVLEDDEKDSEEENEDDENYFDDELADD